ncbi:Polyketide cyclase / dehydrase and lipid transport [Amycolatopsis xylanica]|uniref:Polyketide cyclase / dehydrase and lipid transport n=1 Tax=Amycolatopsis xylanica TaxID=589385 RepID=A0A1H3QV29_9PSEU|nr:SRPBCC family protein [Amycolatopsis xylanica]SDZ17462.1 Polyketide cyclase / dehydrase and lipid transport [Amycolatopsis xylanica]
MGQISASVDLPAAPDKVWAEFSNPNNFEKWLTIHTKWKGDVPTEFAKGAKVSEVVTMLGMPNTIEWTVDEFEAPNKLSISGTGMAGVKVKFDLSVVDAPGGSKASIDAEFTGQMIVGALGKAVEKDGKKNLDASLAKFAELVG